MTRFRNPEMTDWQKQIIIGTILGGSSIIDPGGKNCYLFIRSKINNWLLYKAAELKPFETENGLKKDYWRSACYPIFNDFRQMFYKKGKKVVTMKILDQLRDIGLAIWFGDCGKIDKNKVILKVHKFGMKGINIMKKYFEEAGIGKSEVIKQNGNNRICLDEEASKRFIMIIGQCLPDFILQKY